MGNYADSDDLIDRLGTSRAAELTSDSGVTPDADKLNHDVAAAEGEINGYLARRYAVPINVTVHPDLAATLKGVTLDVAQYRTHTRRQPVPEEVSKVRQAAIEWCAKVAKGDIVLPAATTPASTGADSPVSGWGGAVSNRPGVREEHE